MGPEPATFRALIERCPMVTYVADEDGRLTYISPQVSEWTGLPAHLWVDDPEWWLGMIHPDDLDGVLAAPVPINVEYRMWARDHWMWVWEHEVGIPGGGGSQGVVFDISVRKEAETALQTTQERLGMVVDAAPVILFAADDEGTIVLSAGKGLDLLGVAPGDLVGRSLLDGWEHNPEVAGGARRALAGHAHDNRLDTGDVTFDCSWRPAPGGGLIGIAIDVTARHRSEERLAHLAFHDALTGLPNRRNLEEQLGRELARAARERERVALPYMDLDHFKLVNDSLGHAAGDVVLRQVAARIAAVTRAGDLLARLGGDEFVLLLPGLGASAVASAETAAGKVLAALDEPLTVEGQEFRLGASIGIALGPGPGIDAGELLRQADAAMYEARKRAATRAPCTAPTTRSTGASGSRSARACAAPSPRRSSSSTTSRSTTSARAACAASRRWCAGARRTGRWPRPTRSSRTPRAPASSRASGPGSSTRACRQAAEWRAQGLTPMVSINASPRELRDDGYVDRLALALVRHRVPPHQLVIEVTESSMHGSDRVAAVLDELSGLGVRLAIDDFGTEYSSLGRLRELPVEVLKVDRSFMQGVPSDQQAVAIVQAVTTLAGGLDLHVVAEGIETAAQRDFARRAGCHYGQGYFWARPLPAAEVTPLLAPSRRAHRPRARRASGLSPAASPR